ncbi:MAG: NADH:flavin oxidoreductase [Myxococcales bacterium]|nr:NADH:flavin oxidoreductase [Myxococcales bacterium]
MTSLFSPLTFRGGATAPNRVALAPMTNGQSLPSGALGDDELAWMARRADGGFGMLITCAAYVARDGMAWHGQLGVDDDAHLPGLTRLAHRLGQAGGLGVVQLFHGGLRADPTLSGTQTFSASEHQESSPGYQVPRAATEQDLARVIEQFAAAAARCERAGFAGIELHGAHGYLLSQFLSVTMNQRRDDWGGPLEQRARLLREVTRQVRARVSPRFIVGVRLSLEDVFSARGLDLDESLWVATQLAADGADYLHASLWKAEANTTKRPQEHPLPLLRAALPQEVAVLAAGSIWSPADAEQTLARGADMVALGRAAVLNPDWPRLAREPGFEPLRPPMSEQDLAARAVSPTFVGYLRKWKNFVA